MVAIKFDLSNLVRLQSQLEKLIDPEYLLRPLALDELDLITKRIHIDGLDSLDEPIGTYSKSYLRIREKNNRGSDTKVIVSLTRQLENDWKVVPTENGYGIGFSNPINLQKLRWVEINQSHEIGSLSPNELRFADERVAELVTEAFKE